VAQKADIKRHRRIMENPISEESSTTIPPFVWSISLQVSEYASLHRFYWIVLLLFDHRTVLVEQRVKSILFLG